jgi:predicted glycosyltransferase
VRILVDINHPAHVHLFRNAIRIWRQRGHKVLITARDKEMTYELLRAYNLDFSPTAPKRSGHGLLALVLGVLELDWAMLKAAWRFKPDWLIGTSFAVAHISKLVPGRSIVFAEDSTAANRSFWAIVRPFADYIATPSTLQENFGKKHLTYQGTQKLAYLHPAYFTPDPSVLTDLGLQPSERFSLIRLVAFEASHDRGHAGLQDTDLEAIVAGMLKFGHVFISSERPLPGSLDQYKLALKPEKMHDLLAQADLLVSESGSMITEAAILGTPSVRISSFVGISPVIDELDQRYQLAFGFKPQQHAEAAAKIIEILSRGPGKPTWHQRRDKMLADKIDVTQWIVDLVEKLK